MEKLRTCWFNNKLFLTIQIIGHSFFFFYILLALVYYKERTIFIDAADFSFELIQSKGFVLPFGRWGSVFTQAIPLAVLKLGGGIDLFLKTYSLSIAFFYYVIYLIISFVIKNNRVVVIYLLTLCLTYRSTFYFSISELSQALALCVLLYGLFINLTLEESKNKWRLTIVAILIIVSLYYFHQLIVIAIFFALLTVFIVKKAYKNIYLISIFVSTLFWFGAKIFLLPKNGYEGQKIPDLDVFKEQLPRLFELPSFNYFIEFARIETWFSLLAIFLCFILLAMKKHFLLIAFFLFYSLAYLVLIVITYYLGESPNMYEQYYILFGFFIAIIIDSTINNPIRINHLVLIFLPLLLLSSNRMFLAHEKPSKRIFYLEKLVEQGRKYKNRKFMTAPSDFPWDYAWVHWAIPQETILISSLENKNNTVVCFVPMNEDQAEQDVEKGKILAEGWLRYPMNILALDTKYFNLPLESKYLKLNHSLSYEDLIFRDFKKFNFVFDHEINFEKEGNTNDTVYSGKKGVKLNLKTPFSKSIKKRANNLLLHDYAWIKASAEVYPLGDVNKTKLSLICAYENDGETYNYSGLDIENIGGLIPNQWNRVEMNYYALKPRSEEDLFFVYVWLRDGEEIILNNLKIEVYHRN
jgi:hypothetical protein